MIKVLTAAVRELDYVINEAVDGRDASNDALSM